MTPEQLAERYGFRRTLNAIGMPTIVGAHVASAEVRAAVDAILQMNVEIDELQAAACRTIARATGAEAGCAVSSTSAGLTIAAAAAMAGSDMAKIARLPQPVGERREMLLYHGHDVNFGAPISQMLRLSGAEVVLLGTANHGDLYHLRGALSERTAAVFYIVNGAVNQDGDFPPLADCVKLAREAGVPLVVDAAAEPDVRPFLAAGADLVITSAHKQMGAPTSGMVCGRLDLVRACYLQHYGIGRAMKVGKEGVVGCMTAAEAWYGRDREAEAARWARLAELFHAKLSAYRLPKTHRVAVPLPEGYPHSARDLANRLRERQPAVWVAGADDARREIHLDLRVMSEADAVRIAEAVAAALEAAEAPREDVAYHDLYWSEQRLLAWPNWP
ncbi:MAG: aminotransferase class V-fold PLP-dependent enzyme [Acidobacteria bacterium]|nr:aminotransferase class V-fold PLP-dependent enzyme [Acidobacteriota bacterium]